jgi:N-acetylated-alpha-linked acidic dipeptidase
MKKPVVFFTLAGALLTHAPSVRTQTLLTPADRELVRSLASHISRENIERGLQVFAPLDRISGGPGEAAAARYLVSELTRLGIPHQVHNLRLYLSWPVKGALELEGKTISAVTPAFGGTTGSRGVTGTLVDGGKVSGHLWTGGEGGLYDVDVRGKIVVVEGLVSPQSAARAQAAGAIGLIHVNPAELLHEMIASPVWGTPTPGDAARIPAIPIVSVKKSDGAALIEAARRGGQATLHTELATAWRDSPLVIAEVRAKSEEFVLLSSHLDAWYSGMTDTGGTNVTLLEFARLLHGAIDRLNRSVRIVWWNGHSTGRYAGSTWFADRYWSDLDRLCVGYVNLDGPGTKGVPLDVASTWAWPELLRFVDDLSRQLTGREPVHEYVSENPKRIRPPRAGDSSFQGVGVPEFSLGVTELPADHPDRLAYVGGSQGAWWWHTPEDTVDKLSLDVLVRDFEWRLASLVALLNARVLPYRLSAIADAYLTVLKELETDRFDLTGSVALALQLREVAARIEQRFIDSDDSRAALSDAQVARLNRALLKASHALNATLYTSAGRFGQDPAVPLPLLPALDGLQELATLDPASDRHGFLLTELQRGKNRVEATLREAREWLEEVEG